jgi:alpha-methylacyl-CoA racemase
MLLADLGADVVRIERPGASARQRFMARNQRLVELDLQQPGGVEAAAALAVRADVLLEGFRPGVMERLGLGPADLLPRHPALVYGRITGWGQGGPLAAAAGHDINYAALSGALHAIGTPERPVVPLNLLADFGGGSLFLCAGVLAALHHARTMGEGQVIDCAMVDGAATLMQLFYELRAAQRWGPRGANLLDGGAPFYNVYRCADGGWISIGALEPQFHALLCDKLGLAPDAPERQQEAAGWPAGKKRLADIFARLSRDAWCRVLEGTDVCFAPVLDMDEAPSHPHHVARAAFVEVGGVSQPSPAPRFSATPLDTPRPPQATTTAAVLVGWPTSADGGVRGADSPGTRSDAAGASR